VLLCHFSLPPSSQGGYERLCLRSGGVRGWRCQEEDKRVIQQLLNVIGVEKDTREEAGAKSQ
jgi:hypothetical protein